MSQTTKKKRKNKVTPRMLGDNFPNIRYYKRWYFKHEALEYFVNLNVLCYW